VGGGIKFFRIFENKFISMLKSMKRLPGKPKLSPEAKTEMERKLINMKTKIEDRKKAAEESIEKLSKDKGNIGFTSTDVSEAEKRSKYPRIMGQAKSELRDIKERQDNRYGARYDSAKKEYLYTNKQLGDEFRDKGAQSHAKSNIDAARKFMSEDAAKLRASRNKNK